METPQVKSEIVRAIQDLPEDATVEDAMERLDFLAKIERGLEQSESDESISHDEIKARFLTKVTEVRWTPHAADDLQAIYDFIGRDSPHYAQFSLACMPLVAA